jgi:anthranilate phosphoribosyltransferase
MAKKSRDEFTAKTVLQIAKQAGWLCSFPSCRTPTVGATEDGKGEINIGTAAHICAAAPGGPR